MAKNVLAAQVNTSLMEGTEATYTVDVRDYCGAGVDISLVTLACEVKLESGELKDGVISWDAETSTHILTLPELPAGRHSYEVYELLEDGEHVALVQGWLGVFTFDNWQEPAFSTLSPNRTLRIALADEKGHIEASWIATAAAEGFAYKAKQYALELRDAMPDILAAKAFMDSFDKALIEYIKVIDGYLWLGGVKTDNYLKGEDGKIPTYGNDGYWYIGDKRIGKARGEDGITPHITSDGYWAFGSEKTNVRAAGKDGINGSAMRRVLIQSLDELPKTEERGVYYYLKDGEHYDVYVWLEPDGWVCVGEANDIATTEVYGLVKLGMDTQVDNGAPVGRDADGQMSVPLAGEAVAGTGKISSATELSSTRKDGAIGLSADGKLMAARAEANKPGVVQPSRPDTLARVLGIGIIPDGTKVDGEDRSGLLGCTRAQNDTYGMVKVAYSSTSASCDDITWNAPVGMRDDMQQAVSDTTDTWYRGANGILFIPLSEGGALRWESSGQESRHEKKWSTGGFLKLQHTSQFSSGELGLELESATVNLLAGVYIASSMQDTRTAAVPNASSVVNYLSEHYYGKSQVYTKQETLTQIDYKLQSYASLSWVQDRYMTKGEILQDLRNKVNGQSGVLESIKALTASQRQNLTSVDSKTLYLVYAG